MFLLCSTAPVHTIVVLNTSTALPKVYIAGASVRNILAFQSLTLSAEYSIVRPFCNAAKNFTSRANLTLSWTVMNDNIVVPMLEKTSTVTNFLRIAPYALKPHNTYYVFAIVTDELTSVSAFSSIRVSVAMGSIRAIISGSTVSTISVGSSHYLDASQSFNENFDSTLSFSWTCTQLIPTISDSCSFLKWRNSNTSVLQVFAEASVNSSLVFTVMVRSTSYDGSASWASSQITTVMQRDWVADAVISNVVGEKSISINPGNKLKLISSVSVRVLNSGSPGKQLNYSAWWTMEGCNNSYLNGISLTSAIVPNLKQGLGSTLRKQFSFPVNLVIKENTLMGGSVLTFSLNTAKSKASIAVYVNSSPKPGFFMVQPDIGIELTTLFSLSVCNWQDNDLPLSFIFGYITLSEQLIDLNSRSELTYITSILPQLSNNNQNQSVYTKVYDFLGANITAFGSVFVASFSSQITVEFLKILLTDNIALARNNYDSQQQWVLAINSVVSSTDCSLVTNCFVQYNRLPCSRTSGLCGPCINNSFIGLPGDGNSYCHPIQPTTVISTHRLLTGEMSQSKCNVANDCLAPYEDCSNEQCVIPQKSCNEFNCWNQGLCIFINTYTQQRVASCKLNDVYCIAVCECFVGFFGDDCRLNSNEWRNRVNLRSSIIQSFMEVVAYKSQTSIDTLYFLLPAIIQLSSNSIELTAESVNSLINALSRALSIGISQNVTYLQLDGVVEVANSLLKICENQTSSAIAANEDIFWGLFGNVSGGNYRTEWTQYCIYLNAEVNTLLEVYLQLISRDMVVGETGSFTEVQSGLRTAVGMMEAKAFSNITKIDAIRGSLSFGKTDEEIVNGNLPSSFSLTGSFPLSNAPISLAGVIRSSGLAWSVPTSTNAQIFLVSNPMTVLLLNSMERLTAPSSVLEITATLQYNQRVQYIAPFETLTHTTCYDQDYFFTNYSCKTRPGTNITISCFGKAGVIVDRCPIYNVSTLCALWSSTGTLNTTVCRVETYNHYNITCSCVVVAKGSYGSFTVTATQELTVYSFNKVFISSGEGDSVESSKIVFISMALLSATLLCLSVFSVGSDSIAKKLKDHTEVESRVNPQKAVNSTTISQETRTEVYHFEEVNPFFSPKIAYYIFSLLGRD